MGARPCLAWVLAPSGRKCQARSTRCGAGVLAPPRHPGKRTLANILARASSGLSGKRLSLAFAPPCAGAVENPASGLSGERGCQNWGGYRDGLLATSGRPSQVRPHKVALAGVESSHVRREPLASSSARVPAEHHADLGCKPLEGAAAHTHGLLLVGEAADCHGGEGPLPLAEVGHQGQDGGAEAIVHTGEDHGNYIDAVHVIRRRALC
mmetsp:Transcript_35581/g.98519  ORF Transcript_35581/g.98519 Transcript_35581/m.98519 type:complete len:209 (-) Transcript_35581:1680-2306(-)